MSEEERKRDTRKPSITKKIKEIVRNTITFPFIFRILLWWLLDENSSDS